MYGCKPLLQDFLSTKIKEYRKAIWVSQECMAEYLRISVRSYSDLENGKSCFSASSLILFLLLLSNEDVIQLLNEFRDILQDEDI